MAGKSTMRYEPDSMPRPSGQGNIKGTRWMPWHRKPTKDVASCDKPR